MKKQMLLGDEALAQGAVDAGCSGVFAYPGTPSTEIMEYVQKCPEAIERNIHRTWASNEKTAVEAAVGMSYTGKRTMSCMKHVGLNVAADPFMNSAFVGANGGHIVTVADDPGMHSSQNEQDSRFYAKFAMIPCLEPSNQQECYDMAFHAYELSEKFHLPVMMRLETRLSHSRSGVERREMLPENELKLPEDRNQFMLLPAFARRKYKHLIAIQPELEAAAENSPFNWVEDGKDKSLGIIACGLAYNYVKEVTTRYKCDYPILKMSQYPLPVGMIKKFMDSCDYILVVEEGQPLVEEMLKGAIPRDNRIKGRLDGTFTRDGEMNPNKVAVALGKEKSTEIIIPDVVAGRPPALCVGCPHIDSYKALNEVLKSFVEDGQRHVFSDIGCYTLGFLPPYNAINTCLDMGASITMAKGASDAGLFPTIAVIGDSTFSHSGMTGLLDCIYDKTNLVIIILDNSTTGMTGGQDYTGFGKLEAICIGLGVEKEHIRVITPLSRHFEENVAIMKEEIEYNGVSVIIPRRECVQTMTRRMRSLKKQEAK
ncbi:MAG: indolepyruvate ferredoxin oxidoreductase [Candidatus Cloacimonetes bacterium]|nr:indolepyruvate ferredoxin oxidoreductase [Candidatus Cloacimonadota bacterium]